MFGFNFGKKIENTAKTIGLTAMMLVLMETTALANEPNAPEAPSIEGVTPLSKSHIDKLKTLSDTVEANFSNGKRTFENNSNEYVVKVNYFNNEGTATYIDTDKDGDVDQYIRTGKIEANWSIDDLKAIAQDKSNKKAEDARGAIDKIQGDFATEINNLSKVEQNKKAKLFETELAKKNVSGTSNI